MSAKNNAQRKIYGIEYLHQKSRQLSSEKTKPQLNDRHRRAN